MTSPELESNSWLTRLEVWAEDGVEWLEQRMTFVVAAVAALLVAGFLLRAAAKPYWFDEMATYYPATFPHLSDLLRFFRDGIDVHTPTASLVLRASLAIFGDHPSTNRLPFILGYVVMCLCVYRFVARRLPAVYAAIALLIPALAQTNYYATELRAYALELAFAGLAFLFWQAATEGRRRAFSIPMLFLCLAATVCCHYYAVLILIPFFLAEIARFWTTRRLDLPLCASLVLSPLPLVGFVPAIEAARRGYQAGMWSKPRLSQIPAAYTEMVGNLLLPVLALFLLISLYRSRKTGSFRKTDSFRTPVPLAETVLAGGLALLPLVSVPLSFFAGGFVTRYILLTIAGIAMIVSYGAYRLFRGNLPAAAALAAVLLLMFIAQTIHTFRSGAHGLNSSPYSAGVGEDELMKVLRTTNLPVVATPFLFYMNLQHYAPVDVRSRFVYAASEKKALALLGFNSGETNMVRFSQRLPLRVQDFDQFVEQNSRFLLCAEILGPTWQLTDAIRNGARLQLIAKIGTILLFDVTYPKPPSTLIK